MQAVTAFEPMTTGSPKVDPSTRPAADFVIPAGLHTPDKGASSVRITCPLPKTDAARYDGYERFHYGPLSRQAIGLAVTGPIWLASSALAPPASPPRQSAAALSPPCTAS
jgi:hypothetical protein